MDLIVIVIVNLKLDFKNYIKTVKHAGKQVLKIGHKKCPKFVEKYAWSVTNIS